MIFWLLMMVICDPLASTHVTIIFEPMRWPRHIQYEISNSSYYISISTTIIYDNARPCGCVCVSLFFRCFCCCWHDSTHILFSFDVFFRSLFGLCACANTAIVLSECIYKILKKKYFYEIFIIIYGMCENAMLLTLALLNTPHNSSNKKPNVMNDLW